LAFQKFGIAEIIIFSIMLNRWARQSKLARLQKML
jgi:hypothetical protein